MDSKIRTASLDLRSRLSIFAVEPRMLFDGAMAPTGHAMLDQPHADATPGTAPGAPSILQVAIGDAARPQAERNAQGAASAGAGRDGAHDAERAGSLRENGALPAHVNLDPVASDNLRQVDSDQCIEDGQAIAGDAYGNAAAHDPDGGQLTITGAVPGKVPLAPREGRGLNEELCGDFGTLNLQPDGSYVYKPYTDLNLEPGRQVTDVFSYTLCDQQGGEATGHITIIVTGAQPGQGTDHGGDACGHPGANADQYWINNQTSIDDGQAIRGDHNQGDWHHDVADSGNKLSVVGISAGTPGASPMGGVGTEVAGQYGTLVIQSDGSYTYHLNDAARDLVRDQRVDDVFTYTVRDECGVSASTTITINILGLNRAPDGGDHTRTTTGDAPITDGRTIGEQRPGDRADTDADGDALYVTGVTAGVTDAPGRSGVGTPIHGQYGDLTMNADGSYTYVPRPGLVIPAGQTVQDTFSYLICDDHGGDGVGRVTIVVGGPGGPGGPGEPGGPGNPGEPGGPGEPGNPGGPGEPGGPGNPGEPGNPGNPGGPGGPGGPGEPGNPGGPGGPGNPGNPGGPGGPGEPGNPGGPGEPGNPGEPGGPGGPGEPGNPGNPGGPGGPNGPGEPGSPGGSGGPGNPGNPGGPGGSGGPGGPGGTDGSDGSGPRGSGPGGPQVAPVPGGFTDPVLSGAGAATPRYSGVVGAPVLASTFSLPPDQFNAFGPERVKGWSDEAPAAPADKASPVPVAKAAPHRAASAQDECVPTVKPVAKHAPAHRPTALRPSVFARPEVNGPPKGFSEQLKVAPKRSGPPARIVPTRAPVQNSC